MYNIIARVLSVTFRNLVMQLFQLMRRVIKNMEKAAVVYYNEHIWAISNRCSEN